MESISRRRMLKGVGATIALPFLEAMIPKGIYARGLVHHPKRMAFMFMPNGVHPDKWTPQGEGKNFELSPILNPLRSLKQDITVFSELMNHNSDTRQEGHYTKTANFLTCMPIQKTKGTDINSGGTSVDQYVANHIGKQTLFPSLEYGVDRIRTGVDMAVGFTRLYGANISWKSPTQPCAKEINPRLAFDRLFRGYVPGKSVEPDNPWKRSVLDMVRDDAKSLQKELGIEDANKLEEYLESIRSIEKRLDNKDRLKDFESSITADIRRELKRVDVQIDEYVEFTEGVDITEKVRLMIDIMVLAFWSDATRVSTFMFGNSVSNRNFSFLAGVNGNHHSISHHKNDPRQMSQYEAINIWHMEQYAYFLQRLKSIKEGDGTLLDNSMILIGSGLRDGNRHSPVNLPIVLGGHGGGVIDAGKHIVSPEKTPLANLYLSMIHIMGIDAPYFGDSTNEMCELYT